MSPIARPPWVPIAIVTVSGFCSLVYQVVWERMLRYHLGGDSIAVAIVTGTFLLGLGLGAVLFARWRRRPARWYAAIEAAIGLYGLVSFPVLTGLSGLVGHAFATPVSAAAGLRPAVVVASVAFLLPPCVLIGATGPLMFNCFVRSGGYRARTVGALYGMNTAGAALGVVAVPFLLLNRFSLSVTLALIAATNLLLAAAIWRYGAAPEAVEPAAPRETTAEAAAPGALAWTLGLASLSGLLSLAFEVTLFRALSVLNPSSPYNFPAVLIPFLLAIAVASVVFTRLPVGDRRQALRRIGLLFVAAAGAMLLAVAISGGLSLRGYPRVGLSPAAGAVAVVVHATLLAASLPLLLGAVLPLLLRVAAPSGRELPARAGPIYLANALGAFTGALSTQFVGFPAVGARGVLVALFELSVVAGGVCLWQAGRHRAPGRALRLALLAGVALGPWLVPDAVWRAFAWGVTTADADVVEGVTGVATIVWRPAGGEVFVNGQSMSRLPDHPRHVRLVSLALALPRRDRVLLLGLGGGGMVRDLLRDPAIARVDVVDWSDELPRLLDRPRARRLLDDALHSPRVTLYGSDARVAVSRYPAGTFDVVIDNLAIAHWVGATSVKSRAYFRQIRRILAPDGVFVYHGNYGGARAAILAGLTETFASVQLHPGTGLVDEVVLASARPPEIAASHVADTLRRLDRTGMRSPDELLGRLVPVRREELGRTRPVRDDLLVYEYHRDPVREVRRALRSFVRSLGRAAER